MEKINHPLWIPQSKPNAPRSIIKPRIKPDTHAHLISSGKCTVRCHKLHSTSTPKTYAKVSKTHIYIQAFSTSQSVFIEDTTYRANAVVDVVDPRARKPKLPLPEIYTKKTQTHSSKCVSNYGHAYGDIDTRPLAANSWYVPSWWPGVWARCVFDGNVRVAAGDTGMTYFDYKFFFNTHLNSGVLQWHQK